MSICLYSTLGALTRLGRVMKVIGLALPMALCASASIAPLPASAQESQTRIIDHFVIHRAVIAKPGQRRSSVDFVSKPELGPVWVILDYTAKKPGLFSTGTTSFEVLPEGVKVPINDSFMLFQARNMANYEMPESTFTLSYSGKSRVLTAAEVKGLMSKENYEKYMAALSEEKKRTKDWVQLIQTNTYQIPATEVGKIHVETRTLENMQPMNLEVFIGQGPIPPEMKAYMEKRNRSWFHRYQNFIYMMLAFAALYFLAVRFLWKR